MHILRRTSILWAATIALTPCAAAAADPSPSSPPSPPPPPPPLSPEEGAKALRLPDGFRATLFAGEPDVVQPIAFTFDERGRLWVVECLSYPNWVPVGSKAAQDRVAIFTDKDNDGRFDEKKVFLADGRNLSGIEVGFGGVWLCSVPELLFVPDRDGNDAPDGPPEVVLDGWDLRAKHNVFNSLAWGPDGWLYGLNGILSSSLVGKPGAAAADRVPIDCGVWRYHVGRRRFEAVAHGTTNPWGIDWDDRGRMFITNCVIEHLWHVVPGAHFRRMYGEDLDPHVYTLLASGVDHIHWAGGAWQTSRGGQGAHGAAGGGHAHAGCMVYLGESWPRDLRDSVFLCNIHGSRVNRDSVAPKGSTVVFRHERDFLQSADPWFRGLVLKQGPDDSAFLADWNDTGECHDYDEARVDTGRIFKISYGSGARPPEDLRTLSELELARLQTSKNEWVVRQARRLLAERAAARGAPDTAARNELLALVRAASEVAPRLRALWALHAAGGVPEALSIELLADSDEHIRAWMLELALERTPEGDLLAPRLRDAILRLVQNDASPVVRLRLASVLGRLPPDLRWTAAESLAARPENAEDDYIEHLAWYAVEPMLAAPTEFAEKLLRAAKSPLLRELAARRLADPEVVARVVASVEDGVAMADLLRGLEPALRGRRNLTAPAAWKDAQKSVEARGTAEAKELSRKLSYFFGDPGAARDLRAAVVAASIAPDVRERALDTLLQGRDAQVEQLLRPLASAVGPLRGAAIRALAAFDGSEIPGMLIDVYAKLEATEKADAIATLAARPAYALALLDAVEKDRLPRRDLTSFTVRQLAKSPDERVRRRLGEVWGEARTLSQEKEARLRKYREVFTEDRLKSADRSRGRAVFAKTCGACHKLFGEGGSVGPDLTGSQRSNLDYLLENLLDPSALVGRNYQMSVLQTKDGRLLTGIVLAETGAALTLRTPTEEVVVPVDEIVLRERTNISVMPEDLLERLTEVEACDLIAYLAGAEQAPLPDGAGK